MTAQECAGYVAFLIEVGLEVEPTTEVTGCRDPADDHILALALDGGASTIVTGDADLLALHPFRGISILTPRAFFDALDPREGTSA